MWKRNFVHKLHPRQEAPTFPKMTSNNPDHSLSGHLGIYLQPERSPWDLSIPSHGSYWQHETAIVCRQWVDDQWSLRWWVFCVLIIWLCKTGIRRKNMLFKGSGNSPLRVCLLPEPGTQCNFQRVKYMDEHVKPDDGRKRRFQEAEFQERVWKEPACL